MSASIEFRKYQPRRVPQRRKGMAIDSHWRRLPEMCALVAMICPAMAPGAPGWDVLNREVVVQILAAIEKTGGAAGGRDEMVEVEDYNEDDGGEPDDSATGYEVVGDVRSALFAEAKIQPGEDTVFISLEVSTPGTSDLEVRFGSEQKYDLLLKDARGRALWQWSAGRAFGASPVADTVGPGRSILRWNEFYAGDLKPGEYELVGSLLSENYPLQSSLDLIIRPPETRRIR